MNPSIVSVINPNSFLTQHVFDSFKPLIPLLLFAFIGVPLAKLILSTIWTFIRGRGNIDQTNLINSK